MVCHFIITDRKIHKSIVKNAVEKFTEFFAGSDMGESRAASTRYCYDRETAELCEISRYRNEALEMGFRLSNYHILIFLCI